MEPEFYLLPLLASKDRVAIDAGANTGVFTYRLSRLASSVIAFEPIGWLADRLVRAALPNVRVENAGLSDEDGVAKLKIPVVHGVVRHTRAALDSSGGQIIEQDVVLKSLDSLGLDNVGFIKIDVEGHEYPLLIGAQQTILNNKPNVFIELENWRMSGKRIDGVFQLFRDWGYEGYFYWKGKLHTIDGFDESVHQARQDDVYKSDDYVNNFIFIAGGAKLVLPAVLR